jgi:hypothetical protein
LLLCSESNYSDLALYLQDLALVSIDVLVVDEPLSENVLLKAVMKASKAAFSF